MKNSKKKVNFVETKHVLIMNGSDRALLFLFQNVIYYRVIFLGNDTLFFVFCNLEVLERILNFNVSGFLFSLLHVE